MRYDDCVRARNNWDYFYLRYHMYCRSVLSSCRREAAQCGAVRGGAKRSDSETKGF